MWEKPGKMAIKEKTHRKVPIKDARVWVSNHDARGMELDKDDMRAFYRRTNSMGLGSLELKDQLIVLEVFWTLERSWVKFRIIKVCTETYQNELADGVSIAIANEQTRERGLVSLRRWQRRLKKREEHTKSWRSSSEKGNGRLCEEHGGWWWLGSRKDRRDHLMEGMGFKRKQRKERTPGEGS